MGSEWDRNFGGFAVLTTQMGCLYTDGGRGYGLAPHVVIFLYISHLIVLVSLVSVLFFLSVLLHALQKGI